MSAHLPMSDFYAEHDATPERRLMLAVLLTAILDAAGKNTGTTTPRTRNVARGTALGWIKDADPDFCAVCELAGLDPIHVRRAALDFIESGKPIPRVPRVPISGGAPRGRKQKAPRHA
jgi:hypothetical protein